jgi:hypothetical protein
MHSWQQLQLTHHLPSMAWPAFRAATDLNLPGCAMSFSNVLLLSWQLWPMQEAMHHPVCQPVPGSSSSTSSNTGAADALHSTKQGAKQVPSDWFPSLCHM